MSSRVVAHRVRLDTIGGVERLFTGFLKEATETCDVIVSNKKIHPYLSTHVQSRARRIYMEKRWGPFPVPRFLRSAYKKRILKRSAPNLLVYWNSYVHTPPLIPYIYYEHGHGWTNPNPTYFSRFINGAKAIFTCSKAGKTLLEQRWQTHTPIYVVPNAGIPELCSKGSLPKKLDLNRPLNLGLSGRFHPVKGHCLALHILKGLVSQGIDARLLLPGWGVEEASLRALSLKLNIHDKVKFLGNLQDPQAFYSACDIYLAPSLRESFGLSVVEAMSYGCVPVVSNVDGLAEVVEPDISGMVVDQRLPLINYPKYGGSLHETPFFVTDPKTGLLRLPAFSDPGDFIDKLVYLLEHPKLFETLSQNAINRVKTLFPFNRFTEKLNTCINMFS